MDDLARLSFKKETLPSCLFHFKGSLTGEFEENNSARITNRDGEESSLGGASSSEEYFYDSLEDGSNSRLSNNNTLSK